MKNFRTLSISVGLLGLSLAIYTVQAMDGKGHHSWQPSVAPQQHLREFGQPTIGGSRFPQAKIEPSLDDSSARIKQLGHEAHNLGNKVKQLANDLNKDAKHVDTKGTTPINTESLQKDLQKIHKDDVPGQINAASSWLEKNHAKGIAEGTIDPKTELRKLFPGQMKDFENSAEGKQWLAEQQARKQSLKTPGEEIVDLDSDRLARAREEAEAKRLALAQEKVARWDKEAALQKRLDEWAKPAEQVPVEEKAARMSTAKKAAIAVGVGGLATAGTAAAAIAATAIGGGALAAEAAMGGDTTAAPETTADVGVSLGDDIAGSAIGFEEV